MGQAFSLRTRFQPVLKNSPESPPPLSEERSVESFLRDAERILDTAAAAESNTPEYVICVSRTGSLRILSDMTGWSLPALALDLGAAALYRVERKKGTVQVEGWSYGRKCLLSRDAAKAWWSHQPGGIYANCQLLEGSGA